MYLQFGNKNKHIIILSLLYLPDHYDKELPLYYELKKRGHKAVHALLGSSAVKNLYNRAFFPVDTYELHPELAHCILINKRSQLFDLMHDAKMLVHGMTKGVNWVYDYAATLPLYTLQIDDGPDSDIYYFGSDFFGLSEGSHKNKSMLKQMKINTSKIRFIGHVQYDRIYQHVVQSMTKQEFCRIHGLDPNKELVVYCPENPSSCTNPVISWLYTETCRIIDSCRNCQLIIKPHPRDSVKHKADQCFDGKHSWEILYPKAKVCKPGLGYQCFNVCDVGVSTQSAVAREFPLFRKPFIYVEPEKAPMVKNYYSADGRTMVDFVGMICGLDELKDILEQKKYSRIDPKEYKDYCCKHHPDIDGRSHVRIVDWIEEILEKNPPKKDHPVKRTKFRMRQTLKSISWLHKRQ